jgi:hypothetical protein
MLVTRNANGSLTVSDWIKGHRVSMTYYGYSEREARWAFRNL